MPITPPQVPRFQSLRRISYAWRIVREMRGQFDRTCNLCEFTGRFLPAGRPPRYDAKCPRCLSVERHRLVVLASERLDLLGAHDRVLHFAPEPALRSYLKSRTTDYVSADIVPGRADLELDAENLALEDESVDVIVASHVLEHVDDALALKEFARILRPGGRLIAMFPIVEAWPTTYENASVSDPQERLLHFGQEDHVRYFGRDVRDRITRAGLSLEEFSGSPADCVRLGLARGETIFIGRRP